MKGWMNEWIPVSSISLNEAINSFPVSPAFSSTIPLSPGHTTLIVLILIGLIGVIMFIYHECDNLRHLFQEFSQLSSLFLKMFRFPALLISYGISFHMLMTLALKSFFVFRCAQQVASDSKDHWTFWLVFHFHQVHRLS